jgi:hypothetical protein
MIPKKEIAEMICDLIQFLGLNLLLKIQLGIQLVITTNLNG